MNLLEKLLWDVLIKDTTCIHVIVWLVHYLSPKDLSSIKVGTLFLFVHLCNTPPCMVPDTEKVFNKYLLHEKASVWQAPWNVYVEE